MSNWLVCGGFLCERFCNRIAWDDLVNSGVAMVSLVSYFP